MTNLQTILMSGYAITLILVGLTAIRELVTIKRILSSLEAKTNAPRPQESLGTAFEDRRGIGYESKSRPQPFTSYDFDGNPFGTIGYERE